MLKTSGKREFGWNVGGKCLPEIIKVLDKLSAKRSLRNTIYLSSIIIFFTLILIPPILGVIMKWGEMEQVLSQPKLMGEALNAIGNSLWVAIFVSVIDLAAGIPMAWLIARGKSKWLNVIDTFVDIPFIVPTATLGYSLLLFWSEDGLSSLFGKSLISPGWLLVILLHFTFSYPVVTRVMVGALLDYKLEYEQASRTLGASPLTAARTVTLPILKPSMIASFILAFARSISETGATMMVAGTAFINGPLFIKKYHDLNQNGPLVFVSFILIVIASLIFIIIKLLGPRLKLPVRKVWPNAERKLSSSGVTASRNGLALLIFFALILIPSLFVAFPAFKAIFGGTTLSQALSGSGVWREYWQSIILTYFLGGVVTLINMIIGLPMAIAIARKTFGELPSIILDVLVNIPLVVPSVALGASLSIFWKNFGFLPEMGPLIFAHMAITYPYFVRSMSAAIERINVNLEEAARTLGAKPFAVFRTIVFPLTKYSMLSGAIMVFTRSVSETGATMVVSNLVTAPVLLVNWVKSGVPTTILGLGCGFLILFSFIILLILRLIVRGREVY